MLTHDLPRQDSRSHRQSVHFHNSISWTFFAIEYGLGTPCSIKEVTSDRIQAINISLVIFRMVRTF